MKPLTKCVAEKTGLHFQKIPAINCALFVCVAGLLWCKANQKGSKDQTKAGIGGVVWVSLVLGAFQTSQKGSKDQIKAGIGGVAWVSLVLGAFQEC